MGLGERHFRTLTLGNLAFERRVLFRDVGVLPFDGAVGPPDDDQQHPVQETVEHEKPDRHLDR